MKKVIPKSHTIDTSKPVWKIKGKISDGRIFVVFVNANDAKEANALATEEGMVEIERQYEIDVQTGGRKR